MSHLEMIFKLINKTGETDPVSCCFYSKWLQLILMFCLIYLVCKSLILDQKAPCPSEVLYKV